MSLEILDKQRRHTTPSNGSLTPVDGGAISSMLKCSSDLFLLQIKVSCVFNEICA